MRKFAPLLISFLVAPALMILAALQAANDPPNFLFLYAFFPFGYLIGIFLEHLYPNVGPSLGDALLAISFLQIPIYGLVLSLARNRIATAAMLFGLHILALALAVAADLATAQ